MSEPPESPHSSTKLSESAAETANTSVLPVPRRNTHNIFHDNTHDPTDKVLRRLRAANNRMDFPASAAAVREFQPVTTGLHGRLPPVSDTPERSCTLLSSATDWN